MLREHTANGAVFPDVPLEVKMTRYLAAALLLLAACHHDKKATTLPTPPAPAPAPAAQQQQPAPQPAAPVSSNLNASADLIQLCHLKYSDTVQADPKFDYDRFELTSQDRQVLQQIADCLTHGPAKGHNLSLVGRADPRGTEEYNMSLGDRRANSVSTYLTRLGVAAGAIQATTRGALDAQGHDDASWKVDRRVDLDLQ
jgi:peptidoglycan-associated lipoprotein